MSELDWKSNPRRPAVMTMTSVVAENVRGLRQRMGWTQDRLRQRLAEVGVRLSRPTVVALEQGKRSIDVSELLGLGLALGVAPHLLLYPHAGVDVVAADDPSAPRYAGSEVADWLWDPDPNELSTAGLSERVEWHEMAGIPERASSDVYQVLARLVREMEREAGQGE